MERFIYNNSNFKNRRRILRKNQTDAEKVIWRHMRDRQVQGFKFFRQYSISPYILDFYCPKLRLAVEIDGGQHSENELYDQQRTKFLKTQNITVIRFWNNEVLRNVNAVLEKLLEEVSKRNIDNPS